jgi:DNA-binding CsgD family transcriptional regulator
VVDQVYRPPLTSRERQVAELIIAGKNATEIAETLGVGRNTTRNTIGHIYEKLGIHQRDQLTRDHLS